MENFRFIRQLRTSFTTEDTENSQRNTDLNTKSSKKTDHATIFKFKKIHLRLFVFFVKFVSGNPPIPFFSVCF